MRLLYVCADPGIPLDGVKGASVHVRQTLGALHARGVEVSVLAARPGSLEPPGMRVISSGSDAAAPRAADPILRELDLLGRAARLASRVADEPGTFDVVYERQSLWSLAGCILAERLRAPLVLEVNAPLPEEASRYRSLSLQRLAEALEQEALTRAEAVLCVSSSLTRRAARIRGGDRGVHLLPNAVDLARFRPHPRTDRTGPVRVVFVGTLKPWHGLDVLVEAAARVLAAGTSIELVIAGDGPQRGALERQAVLAGLAEHVRFLGAVSHARIPSVLAEADVAVAPYPPLEHFYFSPLKVGEYLAAGLPTVLSRCGDLAASLEVHGAAIVVTPGDATELAEGLRALAGSPGLRERLGAAGRRYAEAHLSLARAGDRLLDLLSTLTRSEGARARAPA